MGDLIKSKHNDSPKRANENNSIPKGVKIKPSEIGMTGIRILMDRLLSSMDGIGTPHLEALGISMADFIDHRGEVEQIFDSIIKNDIRRPMRRQACTAAIRLGGHLKLTGLTQTFQTILKAQHEEPSLRAAAVDALGLMRSTDSLSLVAKYMKDDHTLVANAAITTMGKIGRSNDLPVIKKLIKKSKDPGNIKRLTIAANRIEMREKLPLISPKWEKPKTQKGQNTNEISIQINDKGQLIVGKK